MTLPMDALMDVSVIVSHENCPDGVASALILRDALPHARVVFVQHGTQALRDLQPAPGMLWCDFAPPRERAIGFVEAGAIVLDHHRGAADVVSLFGERGVFADEKEEPGVSGAFLAFREVWSVMRHTAPLGLHGAVESFARLAGIRDTWQRQDPRWSMACAQAEALRFWPWEHLCDSGWETIDEKMSIGPVLLAKGAERDAKSIGEAFRFTSHGVRVLCFEGGWTSDISDRLASEVDLVLGWHYLFEREIPRLVVSCRSRGPAASALDFAKSHGGGGHTQAAGFTIEAPVTNPYAWLRASVSAFLTPSP